MGDYLMSLIKANNITNVTGGIPTVKSQQLIPTAWVNFNGTGTVAIRDSENVSSITDNGTGDYTINFATAMANTNYCSAMSNNYAANFAYQTTFESVTTSGFTARLFKATVGNVDTSILTAIVMGGQ